MKQFLLTMACLFVVWQGLLAQFSIGETSFTFNDAGRNINTNICYPATTAGNNTPLASGQFPIIVFGHGFQLSPADYDWVKDVLVPKGYIVLLPNFSLNIFAPDHVRLGVDVAFIIDEMFNNPPPFFVGAVDMRAAVMGHSMGGGVTYHAAASNPNVTTTVTMAAEADTSPTDVPTVAPNVSVPSLVIAGSDDCVSTNATDQIPIYNALGAAYKFYIAITGGSHCQFTDGSFTCSFGELSCSAPGITEATQHSAAIPLFCNWLDYYLKDDCQAFLDFLDATSGSAYQDIMETSATRPFDTPVIDATASPSLVANAIGGTYSYQWYLDGNAIPNANTANYTATSNGDYTVAITNVEPCTAVSAVTTVSSFTPQVKAKIKALLQGPYDSAGTMNADITALLPTAEPYTALGFMVSNNGVTFNSSINSLTGNDVIVDWVLVEVRSSTTTIAETVAALIQKDGDIVAVDGFSAVAFTGISAGMYHVVVRHRNHLGVMTQNMVMLNAN